MKTHKIKFGGEYTHSGYDDQFVTYCGITEECSDNVKFVRRHEKATCKKCESFFQKEMERLEKEFQ